MLIMMESDIYVIGATFKLLKKVILASMFNQFMKESNILVNFAHIKLLQKVILKDILNLFTRTKGPIQPGREIKIKCLISYNAVLLLNVFLTSFVKPKA